MIERDLSRLTGLVDDAALDRAYGPELIEATARIFRGVSWLDVRRQSELVSRITTGPPARLVRRKPRNSQ